MQSIDHGSPRVETLRRRERAYWSPRRHVGEPRDRPRSTRTSPREIDNSALMICSNDRRPRRRDGLMSFASSRPGPRPKDPAAAGGERVMSSGNDLVAMIARRQNLADYRKIHWQGGFADYLDIIRRNPKVTRTAYQRVYDMIMSYGTEEISVNKEKRVRFKFFDDPDNNGQDAIFGLDRTLLNLVNIFKSAANRYGTERRVLLLHGPVGSSKSTITRLLKKGLERYSRTDDGALYSFGWLEDDGETYAYCPMHEEPLHLIPHEFREEFLAVLNTQTATDFTITIEGDLCPFCRQMFNERMERHEGDLSKVLGEIRVRRQMLSEQDRVGIGTFQPKDEKNQDATELTGDINYRKIAEYGSESDPRAFNFDGEFNIANRGVIEFIEVLKLDVAFLYDLLGASQEHKIKPKKFAQTDIDEVIIGHTNEPEYKKLQSNEFMEALRDRTVKIDVPYVTRLIDEIRIYEKDYNSRKVRGKAIAPHTLEIAAMWAVLTRLEEPKNAGLTLMQKLKLYNGKTLPGFTEDNIKELREEAEREGMHGISPRYVQDKISNALVAHAGERSVNPFMVLNELESGLKHHSLINNEEVRKHYKHLISVVKEEYDDIVKNEVQRAIAADEDALTRLCGNYIDNVKAFTQREKVKNKFTGQTEEPDERLMRSIEEKIDIPDSRKEDFRREIMNYIGALSLDGKKFDYKTNERLQKALELKLFQDQKDTIKLTSLVSSVVDKDTQEKIDIVKSRLIRNYGYDEDSATDVLNYVASIFARGDVKRGSH
jgi:serine protein kinase